MDNAPVIPDLTLLRPIGRGSYGEVWLARTLTGVYRAVKVVFRARFEDERPFLRELDGITRFQQSAGDQPRQLALMHVGRNDDAGFFYYVMELADDVTRGTDIDPDTYQPHTLKAHLERAEARPATAAVRLGIELARALKGLHDAGLVHRDVKPSNIIFVAGAPKIADIGLVSSSDHTLTSLGTPGYSPPEGAGTMRADLFSLGRILYEVATGRRPNDFPLLPKDIERRRDTAVLLEINEVILRACAPRPEDRYAGVDELLDDLLLIEAGKSVKELLLIRRRLKALARFAGVAAAAALVVLAGLGVQNYFALRRLAAAETAAREQAERDERLARYTADLNLAQLSLSAGDAGLARAALRRQVPPEGAPDPRGLEWRALWNETTGDQDRVLGEVGGPPVRALALAPDGRLLAAQAGEAERETIVWDLETGARRVLASGTYGLAGFTDDGSRLVVGTADRAVRAIDLATGEASAPQAVTGRVLEGTENPRAMLVGEALGPTFRIIVWDGEAGAEVGRWEPAARNGVTRFSALAVAPDAALLAAHLFWTEGATRRRELVLVDLATGAERVLPPPADRLYRLRFSRDGRLLAAGGADQPIRVIETASGETLRTFAGHDGEIFDLAFAPDGRHLASAGEDKTLRVWSLEEETAGLVLRGHESAVEGVLWPTGNRILTAGADGTARSWTFDAARPGNARDGFWSETLGDLVFDPSGATFAATLADGRTGRFGALTLEPVGGPLDVFHPLAFSDGTLRALGRSLELAIVDLASGAVAGTGLRWENPARLMAVAASDDGGTAALGGADGAVVFWDLVNRQPLPGQAAHDTAIWAVAVSPDGALGASGDMAGNARLWRTRAGSSEPVDTGITTPVTALAFSPDGRRLVVGREDGRVAVLETATLRPVAAWQAHLAAVAAAAFSPDGARLATGGFDGNVIVFSTDRWRQLAILRPDADVARGTSALYRVRLSPDGRALVVLSEKGGWVRRWRLD